MATKKKEVTKAPEPIEKSGEVMFEAKPAEPKVVSLCTTCSYLYPRCGGDRAPGFNTENGVIVECSMYRIKPEAQPGPTPSLVSELRTEPKPKPVPERVRQKREIQARNLARNSG